MASDDRPLSPHLQVYRPQITSILSITHRFTGIALALGAVLFTYWLASAAYGPESYTRMMDFLQSWFGRLLLFGFTFAVFYHLCNGIRHLGWDLRWGFSLPILRTTGVIVVLTSMGLTVASWYAAYGYLGKL